LEHYELYTGRRAFTAGSLEELADRKRHETPTAPSRLITDMDPAVERVILRALASDPRLRPSSMAHVAAALPGGDPLEAALRAGETPSPEMVAASGRNEGLDAPAAWALLVAAVAGAVLAAAVGAKTVLWRGVALEKPPEALAEKAHEVLAGLGYSTPPADRASGFEADVDYLRYLQAHDPFRSRWSRSDPSPLRFWYRESPQPLESWRFAFRYGNYSRVDPTDPPLDLAGMALVRIDPRGRLVELVVVPKPTDEAAGSASPPDWRGLLAAGGFDPSAWRPVAASRTPPYHTDARAAWEGTWPGRPDLRVRLEAGGFRGRPVYFEAVFPWTLPARAAASTLTAVERAAVLSIVLVIGAMIVVVAVFASRNLRAGRGDRRGAFRLSAFVFAAMSVAWFFGESHVATLGEVTLVIMGLSWAVAVAGCCWLGYLAAEPFVRRRWPVVLVSWARLLAGNVRDPLVGRDVLVGCAGGVAYAGIALAGTLVPEWLGQPPPIVPADVLGAAYGLQRVMPLLVWRLAQSVLTCLLMLFGLLLLRLMLRRQWLAATAFVLIGSALPDEQFWITFFVSAPLNALFAVMLLRFGLLSTAVAFYTGGLFILFPVTWELSRWYSGAGVTALLVFGALCSFGFTAALRGRPALGKEPSVA
jgi:serine/threonine-protein kinase